MKKLKKGVKKYFSKKYTKELEFYLIILLALLVLFNFFSIIGLNKNLNISLEEAKPAEVSVKIIKADCTDCFDISYVVDEIKNQGINVIGEETLNLDSGQDVIEKYNLEKLPALLVFGEIDKTGLEGEFFKKEKDTLIFTDIIPPYFDISSNEIKGVVSFTYITDSSCNKCYDINMIVKELKNLGIKISEENTLDLSNANNLIEKYKIKKVPTLIASKDLSEYPLIDKLWENIGTVESDGSYVLREIIPPYRDLTTNEILGLIKLTMLVDNTCKECYDVTIHKTILSRLGVIISEEETFDIESKDGKKLINKYSIKKVPTIILSKEAYAYTDLDRAWQQVGTIESDGSYVFRQVEALQGSYKDLETKKIISSK